MDDCIDDLAQDSTQTLLKQRQLNTFFCAFKRFCIICKTHFNTLQHLGYKNILVTLKQPFLTNVWHNLTTIQHGKCQDVF